jgi:hypothetical protein
MYELSLTISVITFIAVTLYIVWRPGFNIFNPVVIYLIFHFVIFVLRPIFAYVLSFNGLYIAYDFVPSQSDKITVIYASNLGFLAFTFFCLRYGDVAMEFRHTAENNETRSRLKKAFVWVLAICGPVALYSALKSTQSFLRGDYISGMVLDRSTGTFINTSSNGYLTDAQFMFVAICALIAWLGRFRFVSLLPLILFVIYRSMTGSRIMFIYALMIAALFFAYDRKIRLPTLRVFILTAMAIVLFRMVGDDRGALVRQTIGAEAKEQILTGDNRIKLRTLESMDYGNMEFFEYLVYVVPQRAQTYDFFLDNFQVFTEPVPRVLWPAKPSGEPFRRIYLFNYGYPIGMTRSLPGEGWYALGWLGVVMWCGLWGGLLGGLYRRFAQGSQTTLQTAAYCVYMPSLIAFFRDGQLVTFAKQLGMFMVPILVWYLAGRFMSVPTAAELRAAWRSRMQSARTMPADVSAPVMIAGATVPAVVTRRAAAATAAARMLPSAVRRRREALGQLPGDLPGIRPDPAIGG